MEALLSDVLPEEVILSVRMCFGGGLISSRGAAVTLLNGLRRLGVVVRGVKTSLVALKLMRESTRCPLNWYICPMLPLLSQKMLDSFTLRNGRSLSTESKGGPSSMATRGSASSSFLYCSRSRT